MRRLLMPACALLLASPLACKAPQPVGSEAKDLIVSRDARNVALVMSGLNKDDFERADSEEAVGYLKQALQAIGGTVPLEVREHHDVHTDDLLRMTTEAARDVGADGTLVWYVGTHGWTDGFSTAGGSRVRPPDVIKALAAGRTTPIRRLVLLFDYCGSGGMVESLGLSDAPRTMGPGPLRDLGEQPALDERTRAMVEALEAAGGGQGLGLAGGAPLYREAIYFSPASDVQTAEGYRFTWSMAETVAEGREGGLTIRQFLDRTVEKIAKYDTSTYPGNGDEEVQRPQRAMFRALPNGRFLSEPLFSR